MHGYENDRRQRKKLSHPGSPGPEGHRCRRDGLYRPGGQRRRRGKPEASGGKQGLSGTSRRGRGRVCRDVCRLRHADGAGGEPFPARRRGLDGLRRPGLHRRRGPGTGEQPDAHVLLYPHPGRRAARNDPFYECGGKAAHPGRPGGGAPERSAGAGGKGAGMRHVPELLRPGRSVEGGHGEQYV